LRLDIHRYLWPLVALCAGLAALILLLLPAERSIGAVIKIVYLHGALSRAGMIGFLASGAAGLAYLISSRPALDRWGRALLLSGWGFWAAHFLVSMPATRLTWGPWVAWGEPRVTLTLQIMGAGLVVIAIDWLLRDARFAAAADLMLGSTVLWLAARSGVIRHPLDPIGQSPSALMRLAYLMLLVPVVGSMVLVAWRLTATAFVRTGTGKTEQAPNPMEAR